MHKLQELHQKILLILKKTTCHCWVFVESFDKDRTFSFANLNTIGCALSFTSELICLQTDILSFLSCFSLFSVFCCSVLNCKSKCSLFFVYNNFPQYFKDQIHSSSDQNHNDELTVHFVSPKWFQNLIQLQIDLRADPRKELRFRVFG